MNYYEVLGLPRDASERQIKDTYRALLKIYHPDHFSGDKAHANQKVRELNEAYQVLVDPQRRKEYDLTLRRNESDGKNESDRKRGKDERAQKWSIIIEYFTEADRLHTKLRKLGRRTAEAYKNRLLNTRGNIIPGETYQRMRREFLESKFGKDPAIQELAETAILKGYLDFSHDLNKALEVLGPAEAGRVVHKLLSKHSEFRDALKDTEWGRPGAAEKVRERSASSQYNPEAYRVSGVILMWLMFGGILLLATSAFGGL